MKKQESLQAYTARMNKTRAYRMEREVARYLSGSRVPMSGSGALKGDCIVPFDEHRSIYVECKFTVKEIHQHSRAVLAKILEDAKSMRAVFGILVCKWHMKSTMIALVPKTAEKFIELPTGLDTRYRLEEKVGINLKYEWGYILEHNTGTWVCMSLPDFRALLPYAL